MQLEPEIETLFRTQPLLAAHPRGNWRVSGLGGITNRSYRLEAPGCDLVLRWPGASASRYLDRGAEPANATAVADLGIAPRVLAADPAQGWYITQYETGAVPLVDADFAKPSVFQEIVALLTRLHTAPIRFPFQQGLFQAIDLYLTLAPTPLMRDLRNQLSPVESALRRHSLPHVPGHIDPNPANFLRCADGTLKLIDWEFAAMEEPLWDLAAIALDVDSAMARAAVEPVIGSAQLPRFELYRTTLNLVAASWCEAEIQAGNDSSALVALRDDRVARLRRRLADPAHEDFLRMA